MKTKPKIRTRRRPRRPTKTLNNKNTATQIVNVVNKFDRQVRRGRVRPPKPREESITPHDGYVTQIRNLQAIVANLGIANSTRQSQPVVTSTPSINVSVKPNINTSVDPTIAVEPRINSTINPTINPTITTNPVINEPAQTFEQPPQLDQTPPLEPPTPRATPKPVNEEDKKIEINAYSEEDAKKEVIRFASDRTIRGNVVNANALKDWAAKIYDIRGPRYSIFHKLVERFNIPNDENARRLFFVEMMNAAVENRELNIQPQQAGNGNKKQKEQKPERFPVDGLFGDQIDSMLNHVPSYLGVFALDELESKLIPMIKRDRIKKFCCVFNTARSTSEGEHWCSLWLDSVNGKSFEYYNSLGVPPSNEYLRIFKSIVDAMNPKYLLKLKYNTIENRDQRNNSSTCGLFAVEFILRRNRGLDWKTCSNFREMDINMQERYLKRKFGYI
jgi:hypothetical protein